MTRNATNKKPLVQIRVISGKNQFGNRKLKIKYVLLTKINTYIWIIHEINKHI